MKELSKEQIELTTQMIDDIQTQIKLEVEKTDNNNTEPETIPTKPNALVDGIIEWGKTIDIDATAPNSVLIVKVNLDDKEYAHSFQMGVIKHILEPRFQTLKEKKITVLFMGSNDDISVLTDRDMEKAGWVRKDQNRIITL